MKTSDDQDEHGILYHHRTQNKGVEGVHIRGMIEGFKNLGYRVDLVGPPGVDTCHASTGAVGYPVKAGDRSTKGEFWDLISSNTPEIFFECMEFFYNLFAYIKMRNLLGKYCYSFVYERYALNLFSTACLCRKVEQPFILEVNDATVIERSRPLILKKVAQRIEKWVFNRADLLITISDHFKDLIVRGHDISPTKILVLPNAIDPDRFDLKSELRTSREQLGINARYVVGCAGSFVPWHGLEFVVQALQPDLESMDIHVLFIGDGPVREQVEETAMKHGLAQRVHFTGFVSADRVPYLLDLLDVCMIPDSNEHASPMKLFEYMGAGKPVILPKYKCLSNIIRDGHEGLFFEPGSPGDLRRCLSELLDNQEKRTQMGKHAKETALKRYTWHGNAVQVLDRLNGPVTKQLGLKKPSCLLG